MKKIALISTYCDNKNKVDILLKNINKLKELGLDVLIISPIILPKDVIEKADYCFFTKDNPVLDWPEKAMFTWVELTHNDKIIKLTKTYADYGWAGLHQVKKMSEIALTMDYDVFYHFIYDIVIDDNVIEGINSPRTCSVYPSKRDNIVWDVGLHFMIFDRKNLAEFISYINLESYLSAKGGDAFVWLHHLKNTFNYTQETVPVFDEIYYYDGYDFFNVSPIEGLKFFIEKNDETDESIKLFFYDNEAPKEIYISINNNIQRNIIKKFDIIDLGFNKFNIPEVLVYCNNTYYDLTEIITKIKHNTLTHL